MPRQEESDHTACRSYNAELKGVISGGNDALVTAIKEMK
jgi:hypothetical protein